MDSSTMADLPKLTDDLAPKFAPFLGMAGVAFAMIFGCNTTPIPPNIYTNTY